ncbi:hypothetical protein [Lactobacillus helveticus]|uniref:hypothetical protein n=1 Tax=Lactobacillus helveticus TaxID=1587 RepID=UPI0015668DD4|nr:hypothetical protein [Lactobacillus helveticus]NRO92494.1 hypothetical protein [Lactobacillus helveticus]
MIDHILFDKHKYISDVQVINGLVDTKLVGKTITRSNYQVYWTDIVGARLESFSQHDLSTRIPDNVDTDSIAQTGEVYDLRLSDDQHIPYFVVEFNDTVNGGSRDGIYISFVKASDVMQRAVSGESL